MPSKTKSPQPSTFVEFKDFDLAIPTEAEIKIAEEITDLQEQLATIEPAVRVLTNRVNAASRAHSDAKALLALKRSKKEEVDRLAKAQAAEEAERADVQAEAEALRDMISDAKDRLATETKRKYDEFFDGMKQARHDAGQAAITALFTAIKKMAELRAYNKLLGSHGLGFRRDKDVFKPFFQSYRDTKKWLKKMDGKFDVPTSQEFEMVEELGGV